MRRAALLAGLMLVGLPGVVAGQGRQSSADWRRVVTEQDQVRLHDWRDIFVKAVSRARETNASDVAREGVLLDPDVALDPVAMPDGRYRCRMVKIGSQDPSGLNYVAYPGFECVVATADGITVLRKISGSQRATGRLFEDSATRKILLGTMMYSDETSAMRYGRDNDRDVAGALERIGPKRWRLIVPAPRFESMLDVVEFVPLS